MSSVSLPWCYFENINALSSVSDQDTSIHSIVEIGSRLHHSFTPC